MDDQFAKEQLKKNPVFQQEEQHLSSVVATAKKEYDLLSDELNMRKADLVEKRRYMWNELGATATDVSSNYEMIMQNHEIAQAELQYDQFITRLKILEKQMNVPYFARIDFKETGYPEAEQIYIGNFGLTDKQNYEVLVCDWRSDIASMYYNYEQEPAQFTCQNGTITGEIELKRQFQIEKGRLLHFFDTGIAIEDEFLLRILNSHAGEKMKTIVSTIQKIQNEIIREKEADVLIINGCAGSGKTSIALHRIAYLIYQSKETLSQKNFLIFSPNEIFNTYISGVLPDLGEQNVWQSTFAQYAYSALGKTLHVESYLENLIREDRDTAMIAAKNNRQFCEKLDAQIAQKLDSLVFEDFYLCGHLLLQGKELQETFMQNIKIMDFFKAYTRLFEMITKVAATKKKRILKQIEDDLLEKNEPLSFVSDKDLALSARYEYMKAINEMKQLFRQKYFIDYIAFYGEILRNIFCVEEQQLFLREIDLKYVRNEDVAGLLYVMAQLGFFNRNADILHVVIDEAQDYSYMQYQLMGLMFQNARFTVLGDVHQQLSENGDFSSFFGNQFGNDGVSYQKKKIIKTFVLDTNYRSSREIVEYTNLLAGSALCKGIDRSAGAVETITTQPSGMANAVRKSLAQCRKDGVLTGKTAIVVQNSAAAQQLYEAIQAQDVCLVNSEKNIIKTDGCVISLALAKGLEFDNVVVVRQQMDQGQFYVACTRALHRLFIIETESGA